MSANNAPFRERFRVGWGDLDANQHLANRAILDRAADVRVFYFERHGFPGAMFAEQQVGPAILRDELVYRRELRLSEAFTVDLECLGLSANDVRFAVRNTFRNDQDEVTATVTSEGVWFDLVARRSRVPPAALAALMRSVPRAREFAELPAGMR
jgi:acyl-CoA thioester hydrolase